MTVHQEASSAISVKKQKVFTGPQIILIIVVSIFSLSCVIPFINVIAVSLSSKSAILRGDVSFWPVEFTTQAYEVLFNDASMIRSLFMTVGMTVVYTIIAMFLTNFAQLEIVQHAFAGIRVCTKPCVPFLKNQIFSESMYSES